MANYAIQVQNSNKEWETTESGDSKSRRKFLKEFDKNKVKRRQWRCVQL
jgi:hypothetical protein